TPTPQYAICMLVSGLLRCSIPILKKKHASDDDLADDPDLQIAFKAASDFSEEARRQTIDFINYIREKEKQKGRQPKQTDDK
ncbi:hypothetical protein U5O17_19185, partial [Bacillus altitudinis]